MNSSENKANDFLAEGDRLFKQQEYDEALENYTNALSHSKLEFNLPVEVESLSQMARISLRENDLDSAIDWLDKAQEKTTVSEPMGYSRFLGVKGRYFWKSEQMDEARMIFTEMYQYCLEKELTGRAIDAAHMVAIVSESLEEQIKWSQLGIETAENNDAEFWLGPLWNNLAGTYYEMDKFDLALDCYLKAREYHWRFSGEMGKLFADYHVGMTYRHLKDYKKAAQWLRPVLAWAERLGNHSAIGQACEDLAEIELAINNKSEGLKLLNQAKQQYQAAGFDSSWKEVWDNVILRIKQVKESN